jgi:tripartite ATP-independent transporter DctP family solute receptor
MKFAKLTIALSLAFAATLTLAQDIQERVIKFGHLVQPDHPISLGTKKFAERVEAKSGGKIKVREFGASALGSDTQQISALQGGVQEMVAPSTTVLASLVKEMSLIDFPFALSTPAQVDSLLGGPFGKALYDRLAERGVIGLDYWETGFRNFTNSRKPITEVEDFKGMKIRVLANPLFVESFSALGANPVPLAFGELYGALESKAVDAQENPYSVVLSSKLHEVQRYMSVTNHVYTANAILISKRFWDKLSEAEKKILRESALEAGIYQRKLSRDSAQADRKALEAKGMKINDVPLTTIAKMRELTRPVADKFAASFDPDLVKLYRSELAKGTQR